MSTDLSTTTHRHRPSPNESFLGQTATCEVCGEVIVLYRARTFPVSLAWRRANRREWGRWRRTTRRWPRWLCRATNHGRFGSVAATVSFDNGVGRWTRCEFCWDVVAVSEAPRVTS